MRSTTDLEPEADRSRRGVLPISAGEAGLQLGQSRRPHDLGCGTALLHPGLQTGDGLTSSSRALGGGLIQALERSLRLLHRRIGGMLFLFHGRRSPGTGRTS